MKDCVDDDAANTNAPATDLVLGAPGFQYSWDDDLCGDPPEGTTASTSSIRTASARGRNTAHRRFVEQLRAHVKHYHGSS